MLISTEPLFVRARPSPLDTCIAVTSVLAPIHFHEFHTIYKQENSHNNNKRFFLFLSFPKRVQELACHWGGVPTGNDHVKELRLFPRGIVFDAIIFLCERAIVWLAEYFIYETWNYPREEPLISSYKLGISCSCFHFLVPVSLRRDWIDSFEKFNV